MATLRTGSRRRRPAPSPEPPAGYEVTAAGPEPSTLSATAGSGAEQSASGASDPESVIDRLPSIRLTEKGLIDLDRMRPNVKARLKTALSDPDLQQKLGLAPVPAGAEAVDEAKFFATQLAPGLYAMMNSLLIVSARRFGYSAEASQVMAFDQQEIGALCPLTGKVLAKHLGGRSKYQDEYMLAAMILMGVMGKITLLEKSAPVLRHVPRAAGDEGASPSAPLPS